MAIQINNLRSNIMVKNILSICDYLARLPRPRPVKGSARNDVRTQQGFILVMVLVLIAFMTLALGTFSLWVNKEFATSKSLKQRSEIEIAAFSLKQNFLYLLSRSTLSSQSPGLELQPADSKSQAEEESDGQNYITLHDRPYQFEKFTIRLQDEGGLFNIDAKKTPKSEIEQLLDLFEVEESERVGFLAKFNDYTTRNPTGTAKSLGGASADDYKDAGLPPPTFKPLRTPWEIKRILGWRDHAPFFEDNALPKILTTIEKGPLNINTAPEKVLDLIAGITPEIKEFLLEKRKSETPYIRHPKEISDATGVTFPASMKLRVFPSKTIRATLSSKEINFNFQLSVSQTLNDQKIPWRINYEIELATDAPIPQGQAEESETAEEGQSELPVFPDPATLFAENKRTDQA